MPTCIYCDIYNKIPESLRKLVLITEKRKDHLRYCRHVERDMKPDDEGCQHFTPYPYFHCKRFKYRLHILICMHKWKQKILECKNCPQADDIIDVARGRDLYEHFGVDRRLHPPKVKPHVKPILRRRKV